MARKEMEECYECEKIRTMTHQIDYPEGWARFCSEKCAIKNIKRCYKEFVKQLDVYNEV